MRFLIPTAMLAGLLSGCADSNSTPAAGNTADTISGAAADSTVAMDENAKANEFFEKAFMEAVMRNPMRQDYIGIRKDQDKWPDMSDARALEDLDITKRQLADLRASIDYDQLDRTTRLSYTLFEQAAEQEISDWPYRYHYYPLNQMYGMQSGIPAHLINMHRVNSVEDAMNYVARLKGVEPLFDQLFVNLRKREERGILPPKFVFAHVLRDSRGVLEGGPFVDGAEPGTLLADFTGKVQKLELDSEKSDELVQLARAALLDHVKPAYEELIAYVEDVQQRAGTDDGVWRLPNGAAYYQHALKRTTTTDLTPDQIHQIGLDEVARIHGEMRAIMAQVGFEGSLQDFFAFLREDEQFYFDDSDAGREAYLAGAVALIDTMRERLDDMFLTKPDADIVVKAVEPFREQSAGKAFYSRPAADGSRPGTYYANLYNMRDMPTYQMEALAYHEGIPGHHMQLAIAQELAGIPSFRKYGRYTAYTEGWGLYTERLPKEFGFYEDPYSDFGRLAMELWRACRLVVDTGIHAKKWSREEAIDYLVTNTPNPTGDARKAIERYIVLPSQATAYKVGMMKIMELREKAQTSLGERFDIREFHDVVLRDGPVPLAVLESLVDDYIASKS